MPLTKSKKQEVIQELSDKFSRRKIAIFSGFHGISNAKLLELRRDLKKVGAEYKVAKKTLLDRALDKAGIKLKSKELQGEIGIAFGYEDEIAPAKILFKFGKDNETFKMLAGVLGDRVLDASEVLAFAKLPSREVLLAQLVAMLQAPLRGLASVLQGNIRGLVVVLQKIKDKR